MAGVWNGCEWRERAVEPKSPTFSFNPLGESRLEAKYWIDWDDLCLTPFDPDVGLLPSVEGVAPPLAQAAFCGHAVYTDLLSSFRHYVSYSQELFESGEAAVGGMLPFSHQDWPPGFFLCDSMQVTGDVIRGVTSRGTAAYDEGNVSLGFRRSAGGYRALSDTKVMVPAGAANPGPPFGDGTPLPTVGLGPAGAGLPFEGYCCRFMSCVEKGSTVAQSIPPRPSAGGLVWIDAPLVAGRRPAATIAAYIPLFSVEIVLDWHPLPLGYWAAVEPKLQALIGKTNRNPFPPYPPPGCPPSRMTQRKRGELVFGQYDKELISMGSCAEAMRVRLKLKAHPHPGGANAFFWVNPPAAMGPPGYYRVARRDGSLLFPEADYASAFDPN